MAKNAQVKKELLYCWTAKGLNVLVPKRRGSGFVKVPYGHHNDRNLNVIADAARCDVFGLDGSLEFQCAGSIYYGDELVRARFVDTVIPRLKTHYNLPAREVSVMEFWEIHPVAPTPEVDVE